MPQNLFDRSGYRKLSVKPSAQQFTKCVPQQVSELASDHCDWQVWMLNWKWMCESVREAWTDGRRLLQHWGCKGKGRVRGLQSYKYGFSRRFPCLYTECMELLQFPSHSITKSSRESWEKITSKTVQLTGRVEAHWDNNIQGSRLVTKSPQTFHSRHQLDACTSSVVHPRRTTLTNSFIKIISLSN